MNTQPKFDDLMLAMDAVDTIRHETSLLENELSGDDRKQAIKVRLREYYASQGIELDDAVLDRVVEDMDKNRFVHEEMKAGFGKMVATAYVRRVKYALRGVLAAVLITICGSAYGVGNYYLVTKPQQVAEANRKVELETLLPEALKKAHAEAIAAAVKYGDDNAVTVVDQQKQSVETFIREGLVKEAKTGITNLSEHAKVLMAKAKIKALEERSKADLLASATRINANVRPEELVSIRGEASMFLANMEDAAARGDETRYLAIKRDLDAFFTKVETPLKLRIVDRSGTRSGVWRSQNGGQTKVFYVVVEALDPAGKVVPMAIKSIETGRTETVTHWGIRVPESEYKRVGNDKSDGIIENSDAGTKPAGTLKFAWTLPTINDHMITRW